METTTPSRYVDAYTGRVHWQWGFVTGGGKDLPGPCWTWVNEMAADLAADKSAFESELKLHPGSKMCDRLSSRIHCKAVALRQALDEGEAFLNWLIKDHLHAEGDSYIRYCLNWVTEHRAHYLDNSGAQREFSSIDSLLRFVHQQHNIILRQKLTKPSHSPQCPKGCRVTLWTPEETNPIWLDRTRFSLDSTAPLSFYLCTSTPKYVELRKQQDEELEKQAARKEKLRKRAIEEAERKQALWVKFSREWDTQHADEKQRAFEEYQKKKAKDSSIT